MKFNAEYRYKHDGMPTYYRTIFADSINEAMKRAERYAKKGYICARITSQ